MQRSEVPADYQAKPYQASPDDAATQAALVRCIGGTNTSKDKTGEAHSPDYVVQEVQISSNAQSFKSKADLDADTALISSPKASSCYEKLFSAKLAAGLPSGAAVTKVAIKITPHPAGAPSNVVGTGAGTITVRVQGQTVEVNLGVAFITGPLLEAEVDAVNVGGPIPGALLTTLVKKVAERAAAY